MIVLIWLIIMIFIPFIAIMIMNLHFAIWDNKRQEEMQKEKLKAELDYLAMKNATKLSYGEKQRLNFALGKHWKR